MPSQQYLVDCLEKFYDLPDLLILELNHPRRLEIIENLGDNYGLELSFLIILIAIDQLAIENVPEYLTKRYELEPTIAQQLTTEIKDLYLQPIIERLSFLNPDPQKTRPSLEEEKNIITDIFKENLLIELANYEPVISAINQRIFNWLDHDLEAKKRLESALLQNQEKVTEQAIVVHNEKLTGSVANWLRCFVAEKGADNFNSLGVSEFLGLSKNTTNLGGIDKKLLGSLLNTYRNIKFFPDSMPSDDGVDWAIIPLPEKQTSQPSQAVEEPIIDEAVTDFDELPNQSTAPKTQPTIVTEKSLDPEITNKINQLELMLKRYDSGSLEGQAIAEEITKLKRG